MNVIITGATGMIGSGVLLECMDSSVVTTILLMSRTPVGTTHPKVTEIICDDWYGLSAIEDRLHQYDACFFCLGASITTVSKHQFHTVTYDLTLHAAGVFARLNPNMVFCYISGMGVDGTRPNRTMWLSIKGKTEQALLSLPFKGVYLFRPGYIQPMRGVRSKTILYRVFYLILSPFYAIIKRIFPQYATSTVHIGRAMISVAQNGYSSSFLENDDINAVAI